MSSNKTTIDWDAKAGAGWILALPVAIASYGYVTAKMWAWFVVPAFGAPPLTAALAAGLTTLLAMIRRKAAAKSVATNRDAMSEVFITPWLFLAIGWGIKTFL